jgi:hypothetical protein
MSDRSVSEEESSLSSRSRVLHGFRGSNKMNGQASEPRTIRMEINNDITFKRRERRERRQRRERSVLARMVQSIKDTGRHNTERSQRTQRNADREPVRQKVGETNEPLVR